MESLSCRCNWLRTDGATTRGASRWSFSGSVRVRQAPQRAWTRPDFWSACSLSFLFTFSIFHVFEAYLSGSWIAQSLKILRRHPRCRSSIRRHRSWQSHLLRAAHPRSLRHEALRWLWRGHSTRTPRCASRSSYDDLSSTLLLFY